MPEDIFARAGIDRFVISPGESEINQAFDKTREVAGDAAVITAAEVVG